MMFMIGFVLFTTTSMMPLFAQTVLGYTATLAGWAMTPGGFAIMVLMPVVGILITKVDVRYLLAVGVTMTSLGIYYTSGFTAGVDYNTVVWARIFQASGFAFLFVPVNTAAYVGIPKEKSGEVSVMLNLMRNLGGSVGISLGTTVYARRAQYHQSVLVSNFTPYDQSVPMTLNSIAQSLVSHGSNAFDSNQQAYKVLYGMISKQAFTLSFNDAFFLLAIAFAATLPLIFLMKKNKPGEGGAPAAH
jgi:DHA2 family multidrug resistance protein